jgi:hypothetical protein
VRKTGKCATCTTMPNGSSAPWTFIFEPVHDLLRGVAEVAKGVLGALQEGLGTLRGWF